MRSASLRRRGIYIYIYIYKRPDGALIPPSLTIYRVYVFTNTIYVSTFNGARLVRLVRLARFIINNDISSSSSSSSFLIFFLERGGGGGGV